MSDYRDVTPKNSQGLDAYKEVFKFILDYLRHPIEKIKHLPEWDWTTLIVTLVCISIGSGVLTGFVPPNFFRILGGFILSPLVATAVNSISALFIYYYFQVYEKRTCPFKKIFTLILFANIPFYIFQIGSEIIPPITLVGFAFTALLLAVGLTENFQMEKRRSLRLVTAIYAVIFLIWLWNRIEISRLVKM